MSELQDLYESINPIPENLSRCGDGYCQHVYMLIDPYASGYKARFEGFKQGLQHQQSKVDELQCEVKRLNLWYSNVKLQLENKEIDSAIDAKKIDELQKQLIDQGQRFNEQSQRVRDLEHKNGELQKRVEALTLALDQIAYPIPHMQKEAELNGCELNGYWARRNKTA